MLSSSRGDHLAHDVRVGDQRAGHPHHVQLARRDRVPRRRHVVDAGGVEGGDAGGGPHLAGKVQVRGGAHAGDRDHVGDGVVGLDMAADDVEEVDDPRGREAPRDLDAVGAGQPDLPVLVGHHAHADQEAAADRGAHGAQHAPGELHAGIQVAAERVLAPVGGRRPELVRQVAIGVDLRPIQPGRLHALRGGGVVGHHAVDVPRLHRLRKRPMRRLAHGRRRQHRQPVGFVPGGAPGPYGSAGSSLRCRARGIRRTARAASRRSRPCRRASCRTPAGCPARPPRTPPSWSAPCRRAPSRRGTAGSGPSACRLRSSTARARCSSPGCAG